MSVSPHRNSVGPEYGHTQLTRTYRRSGSTMSNIEKTNGEKMLSVPANSHLRSSDDNLVHLSSSSSASRLPDAVPSLEEEGIKLKPRLSKSEENLIDLDTPDGNGLIGFTLENPVYDLVSNNSVFEDSFKTDEQLLSEYGLQDYFAQMSVSGGGGNSFSSSNSSANSYSNIATPNSTPSSTFKNSHPSRASNSQWTTFE